MRRLMLLLATGLVIASCTYAPDAPTFWEKLAEFKCKQVRKCDGDHYKDHWETPQACRDAHFATVGNPEDFEEWCPDYDPDEGHRCLQHARDLVRECEYPDDVEAKEAWDAECGHVCGTFGVDSRVVRDEDVSPTNRPR